MSTKTDEKVGKYIKDVKEKIGEEPDVDLLRKVTEACGPSIFRSDAETISSSSESELETVKKNFLIKKLGLKDDEKLDQGLDAVLEKYGKSNRNKYRAVVYYLLTKHFKKENVYS
ncbi:Protein of unknown function [Salegentibacter echinorum]|uniref:DUF2853 domain-containing protein n=1 Tax=Salegentibacter echinorum TaxID=1073325 RepID=A0A1M5FCM1_SALEC|nr:DUF2853 family protein [Salegentibacter echinorum]SHF88842.1 Protein of unknown function [Salegentibacter echinorum]